MATEMMRLDLSMFDVVINDLDSNIAMVDKHLGHNH